MTDQTAVTSEMQERFAQWFRENYPGPNTIIHNPDFHAPKILRAALLSVQRHDNGGENAVSCADTESVLTVFEGLAKVEWRECEPNSRADLPDERQRYIAEMEAFANFWIDTAIEVFGGSVE